MWTFLAFLLVAGAAQPPEACDLPCTTQRLAEAWEALRPSTEPALSFGDAPRALTPEEQAYVQACDRAVARFPGEADAAACLGSAAELFYEDHHIDEARTRFEGVLPHLTGPASERAASQWMDCMAQLEDWPALERAAKDRGLPAIVMQAGMRRVAAMDPADPLAMARGYAALAQSLPDDSLTPLALVNAATFFENGGDGHSALALRLQLRDRTGVEPSLELPNRLALARTYVQLDQPEAAAEAFEAFLERLGDPQRHPVPGFDGEQERRDALYNAALLRERLGDTKEAVAHWVAWCAASPDDPELPRVKQRLAELRTR